MLEIAYNLLEGWRSRLPTLLRDMYKPDIHWTLDDENLRYIALPMFRQYHEAIFMIFFPWTGDQVSGDRASQEWRVKSMELCVNSAHVILATVDRVPSLDILATQVNYSPQFFHYQDADKRNCSKFLHLISASIYIIYLDAACNNGAGKSIRI
jgi:hypothetical protein